MPSAYLVVSDATETGTARAQHRDWIEADLITRDLTVTVVSDENAVLADANAADLLVVASGSSATLGTTLQGTTTPFVATDVVMDEMGLVGSTGTSSESNLDVTAEADTHAITTHAGIAQADSPIAIFDTAQSFAYGVAVVAAAEELLLEPLDATHRMLWAFDSGEAMHVGTAPTGGAVAFGIRENAHLLNALGVALWDGIITFLGFPVASTPPTADAGADKAVASSGTVQVGGTGDLAGDGGTAGLTFAWTVVTGTGSFDDATAQQPNFTANAGPYTATLRKTTTDGATGLTDPDEMTVTVAAPATAPTPTDPAATPPTATQGTDVVFSATLDPNRQAVQWQFHADLTPDSTSLDAPTVSTTSVTPGVYAQAGRVRQQVGGVWSNYSAWAGLEVVAAGAPVGELVSLSHEAPMVAGVDTVVNVVRVRLAGGGDVLAGAQARLDRLGILTEETGGVWRLGGDVNASV